MLSSIASALFLWVASAFGQTLPESVTDPATSEVVEYLSQELRKAKDDILELQTSTPAVTALTMTYLKSSCTIVNNGDQTIADTAGPGSYVTGTSITVTGVTSGNWIEICFHAEVTDNTGADSTFEVVYNGVRVGGNDNGVSRRRNDAATRPDTHSFCIVRGPVTTSSHAAHVTAWSVSGSGAMSVIKSNPPLFFCLKEFAP